MRLLLLQNLPMWSDHSYFSWFFSAALVYSGKMRSSLFSCRLQTCAQLLSKECSPKHFKVSSSQLTGGSPGQLSENKLNFLLQNVRHVHNCRSLCGSGTTMKGKHMTNKRNINDNDTISNIITSSLHFTSSQQRHSSSGSISNSNILSLNPANHGMSQIRSQHFQRNHASFETSPPILHGVKDRYRGVWVDMADQKETDVDNLTNDEFQALLAGWFMIWVFKYLFFLSIFILILERFY